MADPNLTTSLAASAASNRKRPRHFHAGPDETEEEQREEIAAGAAAQPPSARLYRHALESIFAFLSLKELSSVLAVSRSWLSAVGSMRSLDASLRSTDRLFELCTSGLARHVGTLGCESNPMELNRELLYIMSMRMSGLHTLHYKPSPVPRLASSSVKLSFFFPPSLTRLHFSEPDGATAAQINSLIVEFSRVSSLLFLALSVDDNDSVSLAPLAKLSQLQELKLYDEFDWLSSDAQIDQLRALHHLTVLDTPLTEKDLIRLLRPPHSLQRLQSLWLAGTFGVEATALLTSLPNLTNLQVSSANDLAFLQHVSNLRALTLEDSSLYGDSVAERRTQLQELGQCNQITSLDISNSALTSARMTALLSRMPALSKLNLCNMKELESLQFLSSESLQRSLTSLTLYKCRHARMRAVELRHVFALQQLTQLRLRSSFAEKLCSMVLHDLTPPSMRMPNLVDFESSE